MDELKKQFKATKLKKKDTYRRIRVHSIRCNREGKYPNWKFTMSDGSIRYADDVVIDRGRFSCQATEGQHIGCGGGDYTYYIGEAEGTITIPKDVAHELKHTSHVGRLGVSNRKDSYSQPNGWRKLTFDEDAGEFRDAQTGKIITGFRKLHLKKNCTARYLP